MKMREECISHNNINNNNKQTNKQTTHGIIISLPLTLLLFRLCNFNSYLTEETETKTIWAAWMTLALRILWLSLWLLCMMMKMKIAKSANTQGTRKRSRSKAINNSSLPLLRITRKEREKRPKWSEKQHGESNKQNKMQMIIARKNQSKPKNFVCLRFVQTKSWLRTLLEANWSLVVSSTNLDSCIQSCMRSLPMA